MRSKSFCQKLFVQKVLNHKPFVQVIHYAISQFAKRLYAKSHLAKSQFTKSHLEIGKKLADNLQSPLPIGLAESHAMFSI